MADFPTVGLKVDLSEIDRGEKAYAKLQKTIAGVGEAADQAGEKVTASARKQKTANDAAAKSETAKATATKKAAADEVKAKEKAEGAKAAAAKKAAQDETRAQARAVAEQERMRRYLQQVRIQSIKMEEAARKRAEAESISAALRQAKEAERAAKAMERAGAQAERARLREIAQAERAANQAAKAQERAANQAQKAVEKAARDANTLKKRLAKEEEAATVAALKAQERAAAQAERAATTAAARQAAQEEKNRKYLQQVRINSIRMEEQARERAERQQAQATARAEREAIAAARRIERAQAAAARAAARGGGGAGGGGGGSGGAGDLPDPGRVNILTAAVHKLRDALRETRRLFFDVRTAIGVFLGAMVISPIIHMADAMTALRARAAAFTDQASDVPYLMEAIYQAAQRSRSPLESIATLYTRLAPLAKQLGKSQLELLRISETVAKGFQIGGATAEEAKSAAQQLAQALASNRLGGDELRSLAENAPILMAKIAQALNMNTGQFIKWAHAGKANAKVVVEALEKAQKDIDAIFEKFPMTISQGLTIVKNATQNLIGRVNEATGASVAIATQIAKFATFLDSAKTVDALTTAVNALGTAFHFLGEAIGFLKTMLPVLAAFFAVMAVQKIMAIVTAYRLLHAVMISNAIAMGVMVRTTTALAGAQSLLGVGIAAATRAFSAMLALVGGPLGAALLALVGTAVMLKKAHDDAATSAQRYKTSQEGAAAAISHAIAFADVYGLKTDALTKAMNLATGASYESAKGHDEAMKVAMARAEAERQLAITMLRRQAVEAGDEARKSQRAVEGVFGLQNQKRLVEGFFQTQEMPGATSQAKNVTPGLDKKIEESRKAAAAGFKLEKELNTLADGLEKATLKVTKPDTAGAATPGAAAGGKNTRNPFEGAIDGIERMKAAIAGLKQEIATISANPLTALAAQIKQAGDEAAASLEAGSRQNQELADKARSLAMEKERLTIVRDLIQASANNQRQIEMESAAQDRLAQAELNATQIMKEFWGSADRTVEGYTAALQQARDATTNAEVEASRLAIAQRYGVTSLNDIARALQETTKVSEEYAIATQAQAVNEAVATEAAIRRKAALDALASRDSDLSAFNAATYDEAQDAMEHMLVLSRNLGDSLEDAFGRGGRALGDLLSTMNEYTARQLSADRRIAEAKVQYGEKSTRFQEIERQETEQLTQLRLESYAQMAGAAKSFFKEGTAGYKAMQAAETAFRLIEFAMSAKSIVVKAAETAAKVGFFGVQAQAAAQAGAANMFASLGPLGFVAVAAMVAVLAGLGLSLGGGGGGRAPRATAEDRQKAQGAGTVLGDAAAKSESIQRALETVAANSDANLEFSNDMLSALRSIDTNISSLTAALARQLNVGGFLNTENLGLGTTRGSGYAGLVDPLGLLRKIPIVGGLVSSLFGSKKTVSLQDVGLNFNSGRLSDILSGGITGNTYQDIATQTKKKFFGITTSNKTTYQTVTGDIDQQILSEVNRVIASLRDGVVAAADALGLESARTLLESMQVNLGQISFKDMTGEQIEEALQAVFSKLGDQMATIAAPFITELQKAGEGAFETLARVARNYVVLDTALASIGRSFGAVGVASLKAREHLIDLAGGIDELTSQISRYNQDFLTDAERMGPIITAVYTELGKLGAGSITTKEQFKALVNSLDLTTEQGAQAFATLMKIAPAFAQIVDYMDGLKTASQAVTDAQRDLQEAYEREADALQERIDKMNTAADTLFSVYQREVEAMEERRNQMLAFVDALKEFRQALETGPLALNSPQDAYNKAKSLYESTAAAAAAGDEAALGRFPDVSQAFLEASKEYFAGTEPYFRDLEKVKAQTDALGAYAQSQADAATAAIQFYTDSLDLLDGLQDGQIMLGDRLYEVRDGVFALKEAANMTFAQALAEYNATVENGRIAQAQLEALNKQVETALATNAGLQSVAEALQALAVAQAEQAAALQAAMQAALAAAESGRLAAEAASKGTTSATPPTAANDNTTWSAAGYLAANPDIVAAGQQLLATADPNSPWFASHGLDQGLEGFAAWHWQNQGQYEQGRKFAAGAALDGGKVFTSRTFFSADQLAEAGSEAILPLERTPSGDLGVKSTSDDKGTKLVVEALGKLTAAVKNNTAVAQYGHKETIAAVKELVDEQINTGAQARRNRQAA